MFVLKYYVVFYNGNRQAEARVCTLFCNSLL